MITVFSVSCSKQEEDSPVLITRTVLVYMVADNDLKGYAYRDFAEMKKGMQQQNVPSNCRWVVYFSAGDGNTRLIEIGRDGKETVLAEYTDAELSVSVSRMQRVIADIKRIFPSNNYGLVLWSHGTGWLSESGALSVSSNAAPKMSTLSFGYDGPRGSRMKISSLGRALSGVRFEFIYFDCCHMATAEVAYELREVTGNMIASATELGLDGMPYDQNVPMLLCGEYEKAAENTFRFYADRYAVGIDYYGCSISVLDLLSMNRLASVTNEVLSECGPLPSSYEPVKYYRTGVIPEGLYDFDHYIKALCGSRKDLYSVWSRAFDQVVKYHECTSEVYWLDTTDFKGLACNIVRSKDDVRPDVYGYQETAWWRDVVSPAFD